MVKSVKTRLILGLICLFVSAVSMAQDFQAQVQEMYVAYYGRPGDPSGVDFWAGELQSQDGNLTAIIDAFGTSVEYDDRFGSLEDEELINNIFQQLFGRDADPEGLGFYVGELQSGRATLASIALNISDGVQQGTDDATIVANKLELAAYFTESVEDLDVSYGGDQIEAAKSLLAGIDSSMSSLMAALDATVPLVASFPSNGGEDAFEYFVANVSDQVLQSICIVCHVEGGLAGLTRLVYARDSNPDYHEINYQLFVSLAAEEEDVGNYVTTKAQGVDHEGGVQAPPGSSTLEALSAFFELLTGDGGSQETSQLFAGYSMTGRSDTLRRAAMIVAGTVPSEQQLDAMAAGDDETLRESLRDMMQGEGFHKFLIEGANDRLLTDKWIENTLNEIFFRPHYPDLANYAAQISATRTDRPDVFALIRGMSYGIARQPLELIAHVVEQEMPYTEIVTADYTLVNPQLALAYRSNVEFGNDFDIDQWQVATVEGYTRIDSSTVYEKADGLGAYVSGGLATDYPQAGVLNTPGWLARYPSTDTNRNRARARWTWFHFLGVDIERSAPRTTDPEALADTDNPTLKKPQLYCVPPVARSDRRLLPELW